MSQQNVLIIDDEQGLRDLFTDVLARDGLKVQSAANGKEGIAKVSDPDNTFGVIFCDIMLPDTTGIELLKEMRRKRPGTPVVMITGAPKKEAAVEAMRLGAYDYLSKPFNVSDISLIAARAIERHRLIGENLFLRDQLRDRYNFDNIVGSNHLIQAAIVLASKVANQNATVLITGESGTGKEMLARTIHYHSNRAEKPFVKVNCAALPEHLLEDELFGHEKGAFTDASTQRIGRFEWAHTGTIFLDEIGEISPNVQVKLLRVLQEREFERIGSSKTIKVDVRIIAATNKNLEKAIADGSFREDLFYRLNVVPIELPALRERQDDIERLVHHFVKKYGDETGRPIAHIEPGAMQMLRECPWKGNIRELENCIERAIILAEDDTIEARHLLLAPGALNVQDVQARAVGSFHLDGIHANGAEPNGASLNGAAADDALPTLREAQRQLLARALERAGGDEIGAARMLQISTDELRAIREGDVIGAAAPVAEAVSAAAKKRK